MGAVAGTGARTRARGSSAVGVFEPFETVGGPLRSLDGTQSPLSFRLRRPHSRMESALLLTRGI